MPARRAVRTVVFALLAIAVAMAISACGGGSDTDAGDAPLSKRAYIERLNDLQRDAAPVFASVASATRDPTTVQSHLKAMDALIKDVDALHPPKDWEDEHAAMLKSLRDIRTAMAILARASASNRTVIEGQVARYRDAQGRFQDAVVSINATR